MNDVAAEESMNRSRLWLAHVDGLEQDRIPRARSVVGRVDERIAVLFCCVPDRP